MNFREGTRRLALLLGGLGAIAGCVCSYIYFQPVMHQREMHKAFEQLANSDVVKKQRKTLQSPDPYATVAKPISGLPPGAILKPIPPPPSGYAIDPSTGERISTNCGYDALAKKYGGTSERPNFIPDGCSQTIPQHGTAKLSDIQPHTGNPWDRPGAPIQSNQVDWSKAQPVGAFATTSDSSTSEVNRGGIATINWSNDYEVASIETSDGETLSPTPAPAAWEYLLVVLFPVAGFVIPWGAVRAIGWVGVGFVTDTK